MATVEIKGVGKVEVDDSFLDMAPDEQDRTIREIVGSVSKQNNSAPAPAAQAPAPTAVPPQPTDAGASVITDPNQAGFDAAGIQGPAPGGTPQITPEYLAEQERIYQDGLRQGFPAKEALDAENAPLPNKTSALKAGLIGFTDSLSFGAADEIGAGLLTVLPGGKKSIWDGSSFGEAYDANVKDFRGEMSSAQEEHLPSYIGGGLASAFVPFGAAGKVFTGGKGVVKALTAGEKAAQVSNKVRFTKAAGTGAAYGGIYGFNSDEGGVTDRLDGAAKMAGVGALGGVAGEAVLGTALRALPKNKAARFANRESERNEFAQYDAEVVADLKAAAEGTAVTKNDPKGRASLTAKTINSVEIGYTAEFKNIINGMDIPEAEKLRLKEAITRKHSLTDDELMALPKTVEGEAVGHAIRKVQRLRALTPELQRSTGWLHKASNVADVIPGIPGIVGRSMRMVGRAAGDGEAARVNAADKLLAKQRGYQKLGDMVGPSGANEAKQALWTKVEQLAAKKDAEAASKEMGITRSDQAASKKRAQAVIGEQYEDITGKAAVNTRASLAKAAAKMTDGGTKKLDDFDAALNTAPKVNAPTAKERAAVRAEITDPAPDMRDMTDLVPNDRALATRVKTRNSAVAKMENGLSSFDEQLATPRTAPAPKAKAVDAGQASIDDAVAKGIKGDSGVQNSFATRLGLSVPDMLKTLDHISGDLPPELQAEVARIKMGYPTKSKNIGSVLGGRLAKARDELGLKAPVREAPKAVPVDEAAQASLAQKMEAPPVGKPVAAASAKEAALLTELEKLDPVIIELADGSTGRASEIYPDQVKPEEAARVAEINTELRTLRQVDRPIQYEQGKQANQAMANSAAEAMRNDITLGPDTMSVLARVPEKIRDGFKFRKEATDYIEDTIIPDLIAAKVPNDEIAKARRYLYEIADAKTHGTKEELDAATAARPRGRPRKN
jgi:hypothetical protein